MTNKEKYKEAFRVLQPDAEQWEVQPMKHKTISIKSKRVLALVAVLAVLLVAAVGAYAADVGGIRKTIRAWGRCEAIDFSVSDNENGGYNFSYTDADGTTVFEEGVSGVFIDEDGKERPLTPEEIVDDDGFEVLKNEQGRTMLYYRDKTFDITNYLDENGCGKVRFKESNQPFAKTVYVTIDSDNSSGLESYSYGMGYRPDGSKADYIWLDK